MKALLQKDFVWFGLLFVAATSIFGATTLCARADRLWMPLHSGYGGFDEIFGAWISVAFVAGLTAGLVERVIGTREYLLHRPLSWRRVFWTRSGTCIAVLVVAAILPYVYSWVGPAEDTGNRSVWDRSYWWTHLASMTCIVPSVGLGAFAATAHGSVPAVLFKTLALGAPAVFAMFRFLQPLDDGYVSSGWFYVAFQLVLGSFLLWLAARQFVRGTDRDVDDPISYKLPRVAAISLACALFVGVFAGGMQHDIQRMIRRAYPDILVQPDGSVRLAKIRHHWIPGIGDRPTDHRHKVNRDHRPGFKPFKSGQFVRIAKFTDANHRPLNEPRIALDARDRVLRANTQGHLAYASRYWHAQLWPRQSRRWAWYPLFQGVWEPTPGTQNFRKGLATQIALGTQASSLSHTVLAHRPSGALRIQSLRNRGLVGYGRPLGIRDLSSLPPPRVVEPVRGDGRTLGDDLSVQWASKPTVQLFVLDYSDKTLWRHTPLGEGGYQTATMEAVQLPVVLQPQASPAKSAHEHGHPIRSVHVSIISNRREHRGELVLGIQDRQFRWTGETFLELPPDPQLRKNWEKVRQNWERDYVPTDPHYFHRAHVTPAASRDSIEHHAEVRSRDGSVLFEHDYKPRTETERGLELAGCALAALRAPLFEVTGYVADSNLSWMFDPFVMGRKRIAPLLFCFGALAFLLLIALWRMKRVPMQRSTRLLWMTLIALFGVGAFVVFLFLERARAHRPVTVLEPSQRPRLLIHSPV